MDRQLFVAYRLACAFGHRWGELTRTELEEISSRLAESRRLFGSDTDAAQIAASVEAYMDMPHHDYDGILGIEYPTAEGNCLVHTTGSGRVRWEIHPDGNVWVEIRRPGRLTPVITAEVSPPPLDHVLDPEILQNLEDQYGDPLVLVRQEGDAYARHYAALIEVINAVRGFRTNSDWSLSEIRVEDPVPAGD